jgi:hypothetical protein
MISPEIVYIPEVQGFKEDAMNFRQPRIGLSLVATCILLATPTAAQAKQFTKLLQLGQVVPGSDQPVTEIVEPTIGQDGQVAVLLKTKPVDIAVTQPGPFTSTSSFKGIYSIPRNGQIRLLEGGTSRNGFRFLSREEFSAPSISQGKIAYLAMKQSESGAIGTRDTNLRVGTPGAVKTVLSFKLSNAVAESGKSNLAFANGKAYFVDDLFAPGDFGNGGKIVGVVGLVNTLSPTPTVVTLRSNADPQGIRASANLLAVSARSGSDLLESAGDANFRSVELPPSRSISPSFSVSRGNIVVTDSFNPAVFVRLGKQGKFSALPAVPNGNVRRVFNPSISDRSVIYRGIGPLALKPMSSEFITTTDNIYLSKNGQTPISLIAKNDTLDGKTVSQVLLADNGRTIAGNSAVFTASFTDGTTALYRVDF